MAKSVREKAIKWWYELSGATQYELTAQHLSPLRQPEILTGREIENIFRATMSPLYDKKV